MRMYIQAMGRIDAEPQGAAEIVPWPAAVPGYRLQRMAGQEGCQMGAHRNRPHARPAAAVGDAEGLVQIDVGHVATECAGRRDAHQGVEVGAIDIDLAAGGMDVRAHFGHRFLEHPVGGGIGEHEGGELLAVGGDGAIEVGQLHVAVAVALHHHHAQSRHLGAGRIGAVGRGGDQADIAPCFAAARVIAADREQPGVFALGAGVGLQRDRRKSGAGGEPVFQVRKKLPIAARLIQRSKGMQIGEFRPGDR